MFPKETHTSNTGAVAEDVGNLHLQLTFGNLNV